MRIYISPRWNVTANYFESSESFREEISRRFDGLGSSIDIARTYRYTMEYFCRKHSHAVCACYVHTHPAYPIFRVHVTQVRQTFVNFCRNLIINEMEKADI